MIFFFLFDLGYLLLFLELQKMGWDREPFLLLILNVEFPLSSGVNDLSQGDQKYMTCSVAAGNL